MNTVFITGSTGLVGSLLLQTWIDNNSYDNIVCLVRSKENRVKHRSVAFILGDITRPNLGLSSARYKALSRTVNAVFHSAANTSFTSTKQEADKVNLNGTINVVEFAKNCISLDKFGFVSTAYVAGKRENLILEHDLIHNSGFVNYYEESKYNAELYIQSQKDILPFNIYRLSTIIGDLDGKVMQFNAIHKALKLCYYGLAPFIPANFSSLVDFIPTSYVAQALFCLFNREFIPNNTYHIVAGEKNSLKITDLLDLTYKTFEKRDPDWKRKAIEKPALADEKTFSDFVESVERLQNPILSDITFSMKAFAPQLLYPKVFDTSHVSKILSRYNVGPHAIKTYYENIVHYCLLSKWGAYTYE